MCESRAMDTVSPELGQELPIDSRFERGPSLTELLRDAFRSARKSFSAVSDASGIDPAYLHRLATGRKGNPSRDTLIRLAWGLELAPDKLDELLLTAGYAPLFYRR